MKSSEYPWTRKRLEEILFDAGYRPVIDTNCEFWGKRGLKASVCISSSLEMLNNPYSLLEKAILDNLKAGHDVRLDIKTDSEVTDGRVMTINLSIKELLEA